MIYNKVRVIRYFSYRGGKRYCIDPDFRRQIPEVKHRLTPGDARRHGEELTHKLEQKCRENEMLKQRVAEAMAVSSFPTSSFSVPTTTAADTFYSAKGF